MGMAASQARYLEITARKTNVEYEGQQINQQRTALANESAGLFSQLMSLQVPTAPSSDDYTTVNYSFNDGIHNNIITNVETLTGDPTYNSTVTYYSTNSVYTGVAKTKTNFSIIENPAGSGSYWIQGANGTTRLSAADCNGSTGTDDAALSQIETSCPTSYVGTNYATGSDYDRIYKYESGGVTYFVSLDNPSTDPPSVQTCYAANIDTKEYTTEKAYIQSADSGRYSSIQLESTGTTPFDLAATSTTDENAYNDAMNEYTYQQTLYQKQVEDINAKTEVIQNEDRTLELQLKQLDTEQEALQTEMDAVKKVIDKNIEQTFKTFSS
ncbi:MAG: hypothetical protein WCY19_08245 [Candidatus Gastranaerophilaceae bacterium]